MSTAKSALLEDLDAECQRLRQQGLYKEERLIASAQGALIKLPSGEEVINLCANNYLGLANHPDIVAAAHRGLDDFGYGLASVRFICGTQTIHRQLEQTISAFLGTEDTILYPACFDANGGLFEVLLGEDGAIVSDALNHASIIDGVRLSRAARFRYEHNNMRDLEQQLTQAASAKTRLIVTDGVFSMDGTIANLPAICDLANRFDALVMIDDCHATGFLGENGRGSHEYHDVMGQVDVITGTLGKALGGAQGGYTSGRKEIIAMLRQRSRPYLFSNSLPPVVVAASLKVFELVESGSDLRQQLWDNTHYFRDGIQRLGFEVLPGEHPIIPVMLGDADRAVQMADRLLEQGVYVIGFSFPVVPKGQARIRNQVSAAHTKEQLDTVLSAYETVGRELGVI